MNIYALLEAAEAVIDRAKDPADDPLTVSFNANECWILQRHIDYLERRALRRMPRELR